MPIHFTSTPSSKFSGFLKKKDPVEKIEKGLAKTSGESRLGAMWWVNRLADDHPRKIEFITQGLSDTQWQVRRAAALAASNLNEAHPEKAALFNQIKQDAHPNVSCIAEGSQK